MAYREVTMIRGEGSSPAVACRRREEADRGTRRLGSKDGSSVRAGEVCGLARGMGEVAFTDEVLNEDPRDALRRAHQAAR